MNRANRILAIICFLLGVLLILAIPSQVPHVGDTSRQVLTADSFPRFVGFLMIISSIGLFIQAQLGIKYKTETESAPDFNLKQGKGVFLIFALIIVYALVMPYLGFLISSMAFGCMFLFLMKQKKWWYYAILIIVVVLIYIVFTKWLYIFLPRFRLFR
jgi:hypothetical protein